MEGTNVDFDASLSSSYVPFRSLPPDHRCEEEEELDEDEDVVRLGGRWGGSRGKGNTGREQGRGWFEFSFWIYRTLLDDSFGSGFASGRVEENRIVVSKGS